MHKSILLPAAIAACLMSGAAWAGCTSISTPGYAITAAGSYCLTKNLVATSNGISINASNVDLDCGGYTIDGSAQAASSTKRGVLAQDRTNVTVRNCTVKGFIEGINLSGTGNTVRDNVVIAPFSRGVLVQGDENVVEGNRISDVGGTSNVTWGAYGIVATGSSIIRDNVVSGVVPTSGSARSGFGIYTSANDAGVIQGNTVRNVLGDSGKIAMALSAYDSSNAVLKENILVNPPGTYGYALYCSGEGSVSNGNIFQGFSYGLSSSCTHVAAE